MLSDGNSMYCATAKLSVRALHVENNRTRLASIARQVRTTHRPLHAEERAGPGLHKL